MPSEKAKENKALVAVCSGCGKSVSTEDAIALTGFANGRPAQFTVCIPCANGGWRPPGFRGLYAPRPN